MAIFCVVMDMMHHRFGQWGLIYERQINKAYVVFEPGTGAWFDIFDLEMHTWEDTPERIRNRYFVVEEG